jgi:hypothetical protein
MLSTKAMKPYNKINKLQDLEDEKTKNLIIELILNGDVELIRLDSRFLIMLESEYKKQPLLKPLIEATLINRKLEEDNKKIKEKLENALDDIEILNDDIEILKKENKQLQKEDN